MDPTYLIAFIIILSILVFVHELGHFVVAKRAGITVEEFAIGFPPRLVKLWQDEGQITLDGHDYVIGRKLNVPRTIQPGAQVYAETGIDAKGRPAVTKLELVAPTASERGGSEARFFGLMSRNPAPTPAAERPIVTVEALTRPTEYTINAIPFGGYVRMVGEEDPSAPGSFASKSKRARLAVLAAGSFMNLLAAILFFTFAAMAGSPERTVGTFITEVLPGSPAETAGLQANDIIIGADNVTFKYENDLITYIDKVKDTEITLHLRRGSETVDAVVVPRSNPPEGQGAIGIVIQYVPVAKTIVNEVTPDSPAAEAGLASKDVIVRADGQEIIYAEQLVDYLDKNQGAEINLQVERDGKTVTTLLPPLPRQDEVQAALGATFNYDLDTKITYYSLPEAFANGVSQTLRYVGLTFYVPVAILQNILPAEAARPTGPIGIYRETGSAVEATLSLNWWFPVFSWVAILSTALAVTNLLPLPALDGGRILFIIIEAIRGKRIAPEKEGAIHFIGLALLLTLMLVISYYDISSPIQGIDWASFF